jgi:hypothetical protein
MNEQSVIPNPERQRRMRDLLRPSSLDSGCFLGVEQKQLIPELLVFAMPRS